MAEKITQVMEVLLAILGVLVWGAIATLCMTSIMFASQKLGWSRMNWSLLVGSLFTGDRHGAATLGFVLNFFGGCLLAFLYFVMFALMGKANWWMGAIAGTLHGVLMLAVFLPLLSYGHPRLASEYDGASSRKRLEPPGFLALNYGSGTPAVTLLAYGAYGIILGSGFGLLL